MNWSKYSLDEWLEQFGAWCESCRMRTGNNPATLSQNLIDKLMIETGYKKLTKPKNKVELKISDDEAMQVNDLLLSVIRKTPSWCKLKVFCLIAHYVDGFSLRSIAEIVDISHTQVQSKISDGLHYICGDYKFLHLND